MLVMAGGGHSLGLLASPLRCLVGFLLLCSSVWTLNLDASSPTVYSGPNGSYFGFALDFYRDSKGSMHVVVGAPQANTSQTGVTEAGAVYLCPWAPSGSACTPIPFDTKGDEVEQLHSVVVKTFKTKQWFGASVSTWKDTIVACAPLQHWNAISGREEATKTPVGSCFLATSGLQRFVEFSPCRNIKMESFYKWTRYANDHRYCEVGFSSAISDSGRLLLGAPGGHYFGGYSVAFGEFNEDSESPEYVVGVPNKSLTKGAVQIFTFKHSFLLLRSLPSEQVASYFGHTVAVADINGDGKDDILVGAPLFMERHSDRKLYEVGRVYLYLQQKTPTAYSTPWQRLTGTDVYGRFGMAIASLGDVDQDGGTDIAIGAPFAGQDGGGRVYIYQGHHEGLSSSPTQILESPFSGPAGFGFAIRGALDIDANGYPDVLVGAFRASKVTVYRAQPVMFLKAQIDLPGVLNPEEKSCMVAGVQVKCFTIQICVEVSAKRIPQKVDLNADLQLDRVKQKYGRRVLLQQTSQSSRTFPLKLSREKPQTCQGVDAYLRDEADFKDKLSPIVVSFNFSLATSSADGEMQPVLSGQTMVQDQTRIIVDCGEDNVCIPDLRLSAHTNEGSLLIGAENVLLLQTTAMNSGEGAYEAELVVELPHGTYFQTANSDGQKLICNTRKENETRLVACEIGNPMKSNTTIQVDVELSVSQLEEASDNITLMLQLRSKNSNNPNSAVEQLQVPVKVAARMELLGRSAPDVVVVPLAFGDYKNTSKDINDYGPRVEHVYQLQNAGPSTVSGAKLLVDFPTHFREGFLLYIARVSTEGNIACSPTNNTNPLKLKVLEPTTAPSYNITAQPQRLRERRDVNSAALQEPIVVNCSSQDCALICCQVGTLEKGQGAMVTIHAVLWLQTFQEHPMKEQLLIQSQARFNTSGMPYRIQPKVLPSGSSLTKTLVEWVDPAAERDIPVWWIIAAIVAGLFLLAIFIFVLWKTGFFKRKRPPTEEEEQLSQ
nr:integrin alpha-IIb isoform X2 [Zootoca vivipara]